MGKSRDKPHTRVHGQHGLCLPDLGCQLVLPGPDIMQLNPCSLQATLSCGEGGSLSDAKSHPEMDREQRQRP